MCVEDIDGGQCVCVCNSVYVSVVMKLWYTFHLWYFTVCVCVCVLVSLHTDVVSVLMCSRCGLLLCGGVWCTYIPGALSVARAHAPHCDAAESDFGLCPSPSLADCPLSPYTQDMYCMYVCTKHT